LIETKKKLKDRVEPEQVKINDAEDGPYKMTKNSQVLTAADYEHKEAQRSQFAEVEAKVTDLKDRAVLSASQNDYQKAKTLYQKAASLLDKSLLDFPLFKKEIAQYEANCFNNIAVCYGKSKQTKKEVFYCSLVIERALFLDDTNVLIKAYLRRALAYEQLSQHKQSVDDFARVKELQPQNKQALVGMVRCLNRIQELGESY